MIPTENQENMTPDTAPKKIRKPRQKKTSPPSQPIHGLDESAAIDNVSLAEKIERISKFAKEWAESYVSIGMLVYGFDKYAGSLLIKHALTRAKELENLKKQFPEIEKYLKGSSKASAIISFAAGHGFMLYAILAGRGMVAPIPGIAPGPAEIYVSVKDNVSPPESPDYSRPFEAPADGVQIS